MDEVGEFLESIEFAHLIKLDDELDDIRLKEARAVVMLALASGFSLSRAKGLAILHSGDGANVEVRVPTNQSLNFKIFRSHVRTIVRHRGYNGKDPKVRGFVSMPPLALVEAVVSMAKLEATHANVMRQTFIDEGPKKNGVEEEPKPTLQEVLATPIEELALVEAQELERRLLKEEPWTAHGSRTKKNGGGSDTYPSEAVMERTWSDGIVDYGCRWPGCDWATDKPHSVARHYANKHTKGQGRSPLPPADGFDAEWTPKQATRIKALKRELDGALTAAIAAAHDINDTEWIAAWIITHRIEGLGDTKVSGENGAVEEGPLTAEQILDKIAALADRGRAHVLREQINALNALLDQSEIARTRAEGNLHALRDMLNEAAE